MSRKIAVVELIHRARREGWAVGQFNMSGMDTVHGIVDAANATRLPCLVGVSMGTLRYAGMEYVAALMRAARIQATAPLYFHLDHGADLEVVRRAIDAGFDSVMIDTSMLPYAENVARVRAAAQVTRAHGVGLEAQLGETLEEETGAGAQVKTDPGAVRRFVTETGIDYLACSFGNAPGAGVGAGTPDKDLIERIGRASPVPLVVHGGTSLSDEMTRTAIRCGAAKINIDTWIRRAVNRALAGCYANGGAGEPGIGADSHVADPRIAFKRIRAAVAAAVTEKLRLFRSANVSP